MKRTVLAAFRKINPDGAGILLVSCLAFFILCTSPGAAGVVPAPVGRLLLQVSRLYKQGEYERAATSIRKFLNRHTKYADHPEIMFAMGNCCLALRNYHCALRYYKKAVSRRPGHHATWLNMANALYNL